MIGRTYGQLWLDGDNWKLQCEPHVAMWAKRIFKKIPKGQHGVFTITNNPANCRDLEWFLQRFALDVKHPEQLLHGASGHRDHIARLDQIVDLNYKPRDFELAIPARDYQRRAAELFLARRGMGLLLGDDLGIGKTVSAIAALTAKDTLPAVVVCLAHLPRQWEREINRFAPDIETHIINKMTPYPIPKMLGRPMDVLIISYHKLKTWAEVLSRYCKCVIFDEAQELRRKGEASKPSQKWHAAKHIADSCEFRLGLSATPIYNYGGEIYNLMEVLSPGALGTKTEFVGEWCSDNGSGKEASLKDPSAFGSWMRENHLMLRRTRTDVGRELADLSRITHTIDSDPAALKKIEGKAGELARLLLQGVESHRGDRMNAAGELDNLVRQATGIAKAPYVAEFVRLLLENGEPVVLYGWHRSVYEIWMEKLKDFRPELYTGSESAAQKQAAAAKFIDGGTNLLLISLRAGAGLDGLQRRGRTVVFGELDWSPGVHEQCIGRVHRDGQTDPVAAYFLISESGCDPLMAETLGLKKDQVDGIRGSSSEVLQRNESESSLKRLAQQYLRKAGAAV